MNKSTNMKEYVKIPLERIAIIVGPNGKVKEFIEEKSATSINIDNQTGDVEIEIKDPIKGLRIKDIVNAIASGFSTEQVFRLFDDDLLMFETIDLSNITKTEKGLRRIKGRIIGGTGKTREFIENLTGVNISVYGKTISIIGHSDQNDIARAGIDMLLKGSSQKSVYKFLEKKQTI